jgi:hypothetical protein
MAHVVCEVSQGLREAERTVAVKDVHGRSQFLRVPFDFLTQANGRQYLPVGVVHIDPRSKAVLVELPHEADSGANRLWVRAADLLEAIEALA